MEEKQKKSLTEWLREHPKSVFATRALVWTVFAMVLPFLFIAFRYGIFEKSDTIALSGWGIIGVIIVLVFCLSLFSYIKQGMEDGMFKQCLMGFTKVIIPLLAVLLVVQGIKTNIELFETALGVTIACEFIAIPINPFPEWLAKRKREKNLKEQESVFGALWDKFFAKKKENEENGGE